jgi:hypothetical protein
MASARGTIRVNALLNAEMRPLLFKSLFTNKPQSHSPSLALAAGDGGMHEHPNFLKFRS